MEKQELEKEYQEFCLNRRSEIAAVLHFLDKKKLNNTGCYGFVCYHQGRSDERRNKTFFETPKQYKDRTGMSWPDRSVVYWRARHKSSGAIGKWGYDLFGEFRRQDMLNDPNFEFDVLISTEAGCPPDDWRPEQAGEKTE